MGSERRFCIGYFAHCHQPRKEQHSVPRRYIGPFLHNWHSHQLTLVYLQHSTSTSPMVNTTHPKHQHYYDFLVQETGCAGKNDTLACLRNAPYDTLLSAINETPAAFSTSGLNFTYGASVDGNFFDRTLKESVRDGIYAQVRTLSYQS